MEKFAFVMGGCQGLLLDCVDSKSIHDMKQALTVYQQSYTGGSEEIILWEEDDDYLWMPRHFESEKYRTRGFSRAEMDIRLTYGSVPLFLGRRIALDDSRGQPDAVEKTVAHIKRRGSGILQAYTGCGKTIMALAIAESLGVSVGIFVYNEHMLENWIETAQLFFGISRENIGVVQGDRCDLGKQVTVMMVQSLYSREYPDELYYQHGLLIADECNRFAAPVWQGAISTFPASYRLGLSAAPKRKDGLDDVIRWNFGEIAHVVPERSKPRPLVCQVMYENAPPFSAYVHKWGIRRGDPDPMKYRKLISEDKGRNAMMVEEMAKARKMGRVALVFCQYRKHAETLRMMFQAACQKDPDMLPTEATLLLGGMKRIKTRSKEEILKIAMSGDFIFTTYAFAREALNIPRLDTLFMASPVGDPLQPIGRLRESRGFDERRPLLVVDFFEDDSYSADRADKRAEIYEALKLKVQRASRKKINRP